MLFTLPKIMIDAFSDNYRLVSWNGKHDSEIMTYSFDGDNWSALNMQPPVSHESKSMVCNHDNGILVVHPLDETKALNEKSQNRVSVMFYTQLNISIKTPVNMPTVRDAGVICDQDILYIVGGTIPKLDSITQKSSIFYSFDIQGRQWRQLPPLPHPVINPIVLKDQTYIYVIGGNNSQLAARYEKEKMTWEEIQPLEQPFISSKCGGVDYTNYLLIITPTYSLMYDKKNDWWQQKIYEGDRLACQPVLIDNDVIVNVVRRKTTSLECYYPSINRWTTFSRNGYNHVDVNNMANGCFYSRLIKN